VRARCAGFIASIILWSFQAVAANPPEAGSSFHGRDHPADVCSMWKAKNIVVFYSAKKESYIVNNNPISGLKCGLDIAILSSFLAGPDGRINGAAASVIESIASLLRRFSWRSGNQHAAIYDAISWRIPIVFHSEDDGIIDKTKTIRYGSDMSAELSLFRVFSNVSLIASGIGELGGIDRPFAHFVQLALHDIQLTPKNDGGYDANQYKSASEQPDTARPSRHHSLVNLVLGLSAAAATVFVAFKSAEYADDRGSRFWWIPVVGFLGLAFWLAAHAIPIDPPI
jgi:hypothetical protein